MKGKQSGSWKELSEKRGHRGSPGLRGHVGHFIVQTPCSAVQR